MYTQLSSRPNIGQQRDARRYFCTMPQGSDKAKGIFIFTLRSLGIRQSDECSLCCKALAQFRHSLVKAAVIVFK